MPGLYAVDLDELLATLDALGRVGEVLDRRLDDISARVATLHGTWGGRAALAQAAAQAEWEAGFREMRSGLATMRAAADAAHGHYADAARTNLRMWGQLS